MPYSDDLQVVFLHIAKTGGTCIEKIFNITGYLGWILPRSPQHLTCKELKLEIPKQYNTYYKFCFVRNPYDRIVSDYHWNISEKPQRTFEEFVDHIQSVVRSGDYTKNAFDDHYIPQVEYVEEDIDVYRFEKFDDEVLRLSLKLGVTLQFDDGVIPKIYSTNHDHYSKYYTRETRDIVESIYAKDLKTFGYMFESEGC